MNTTDPQARKPAEWAVAAFQYSAAAVFLWLLVSFWQLQVQNPDEYIERAEQNRIKSVPIPAPRGTIFDRDGRVIVDNTPSLKVMISRTAYRDDDLDVIAAALDISPEQIEQKRERLRNRRMPEYETVTLKENLSPADVAFLETHRAEFPGIELLRSQRRIYPRNGLASHVLGYVGEISERELNEDDFVLVEPGAQVGKAGIERQYNHLLAGIDGSRRVIVDSRGREREAIGIVEAQAGQNITLTLDLDLQVVAELAMRGRKGAVVALDPRNGEILALVSAPNYDPNEFVGGISPSSWRALLADPNNPMLNRAIQAQLAPGSIFKPIMALAGKQTPDVDETKPVYCRGGGTFYGRFFGCHNRGGHGWIGPHEALKKSCDVYFYNLGNKLGVDGIAGFARLSGLGAPTGIDLPNEKEGTVPSTLWKLRRYREKWYAGETISVAIGQGALTVTPIQMAAAIGGLGVGGVWHEPHLISHDARQRLEPAFEPAQPSQIENGWEDTRDIVRGMWSVVNDGGTGVRAKLDGVDVCGKTGTAQVASNSLAASRDDPNLRDNAWFVAFAPCEAPEISIATLVEHGEHGSWTAPIARDMIQAHFAKKRRKQFSQRDGQAPVIAEARRR